MKTGRADTWSRLTSVLLCTALLGLGCGVAGRDSAPAGGKPAPPVSSAPLGLPDPASVLASLPPRASSTALLVHQGSDFEIGQRATVLGENAVLEPRWVDGASPLADAAYAVYRFNLQGYSGPQTLKLTWSRAPLDGLHLWLGLSRWDKARWDWRRAPASGSVDFGPDGWLPFRKSDTGDVLVAVVLLWIAPARLSRAEVGGSLQGDWCMTGHDAQRTGQSAFAGPQTNHLKWALDLGGGVRANPVMAADGTIYAGTYHIDEPSEFFAVNPDGTVKWSFETEDRIIGAAVAADGTVYAASGTPDPSAGGPKGKLYAVNPDGTPKWTLTTGLLRSPLIDPSGVVHVASQGIAVYRLYAVNPDGTVRWAPAWTKNLRTPALSAGGTSYVWCLDKNLYAVDSYGSQEWACAFAGSIGMPAVSLNGTVGAACSDGDLYAVAPDSTIKWTYYVGSQAYLAAVGPDGTVYVVGGADGLHAVGPDGTKKWTYVTGWIMQSQPAVGADGIVYVASNEWQPSGNADDCALLAVNPDGTLKWSYSYNSQYSLMYAPAIGDDGTLYVGSDDDHLYAFGP